MAGEADMEGTGQAGIGVGDGLDLTGGLGSGGDGFMESVVIQFLTSRKIGEGVMKFVKTPSQVVRQ